MLLPMDAGAAKSASPDRRLVMLGVVYLFLCIIVGLAGRKRRPGFAGYVLLALFLTPIVPLIFLLFTQKRFLQAQAAKEAQMALSLCDRCGRPRADAAVHSRCIHCGAPF
jgi:hypothetical protein